MLSSSNAPDIPSTPAQLRVHIQTCKQADTAAWELTRKFVHPAQLAHTLAQLTERIQRSALPGTLRDQLVASLATTPHASTSGTAGDQLVAGLAATPHASTSGTAGEQLVAGLAATPHVPTSGTAGDHALKAFTGLPHTKAIRALCLYFALVRDDSAPSSAGLAPCDVEAFVQQGLSPYEILLLAEQPSSLDLGAGDLSFEEELIARYLPPLRQREKVFTLHALDRLRPGSQLGGQYHASPERLRRFACLDPDHLQFRFWGDVDMMSLTPRALLSRYTMVTCHAPATPTFAYEPSRLSPAIIRAHLTRTKGDFQTVRVNGEEALTVMHRGTSLTFPPWKFSIQGPRALLNLVARRGALCVFTAIDDEVFWEILAQLVDDPAMRPADVVFTPDVLPAVFGQVHRALTSLNIGERCTLSDVTTLRRTFPAGPGTGDGRPAPHRFRFVEIRRGAVFPDMPAGSTARQFSHMSEEAPPWQLVLVPEQVGER